MNEMEQYRLHLVPSVEDPGFAQLDMFTQLASRSSPDDTLPTNVIPFPEERTHAYQDYLMSEDWLEQREEALQRAWHRCQVCYTRHQLVIHHRTYDRVGRERPDDLTVLCRPCHELFHRYGRLVRTGRRVS